MSSNSHNSLIKTKSDLIQIFRAFAIIAVVMIHTTPMGKYQVFCRPFINFSVATFLFISGYLTKIDTNNWSTFYRKRITRVLFPYIFWTIIYTLPVIHSKGLIKLPINLLTAKAAFPLYYIFVYIQFVLLTPFIGKLAKSKYQAIGWFIAPISVFIFKYYPLFMGKEFNSFVSLFWSNVCLGWFTFYYLGLILGNKIIEKQYSLKILGILYFISIVLQMAEGYVWLLLGDTNCGTQLKLTSILTSSLFLLIVYTVLDKRKTINSCTPLAVIGDYSFGIYLCHIMVMHVLARTPYYSSIPYPITSAIVVILSFFCCHIGYRIFGKRISRWIGFR